jgi:hypothetical protein
MRGLRWVGFLALIGAAAIASAGDVQVLCEPGVRVFLDGKLVGTTSVKEDGLFLASVRAGGHVVRVERAGFVPQSFQVEAQKLPVEVKVGAFVPESTPPHDNSTSVVQIKEPTGNLVVTSAPQNCVVKVDDKSEVKNVPLLLIEDLAAGQHTVSFSKPGYDRVSGVVMIQPGADVTVRGDLFEGKVATVDEGKGSLRVLSTPDHCAVHFRGAVKETWVSLLNISFVPVGEYPIVVVWKGHELSSRITILKGQRTVVDVSFVRREKPFVVSYEPE